MKKIGEREAKDPRGVRTIVRSVRTDRVGSELEASRPGIACTRGSPCRPPPLVGPPTQSDSHHKRLYKRTREKGRERGNGSEGKRRVRMGGEWGVGRISQAIHTRSERRVGVAPIFEKGSHATARKRGATRHLLRLQLRILLFVLQESHAGLLAAARRAIKAITPYIEANRWGLYHRFIFIRYQ